MPGDPSTSITDGQLGSPCGLLEARPGGPAADPALRDWERLWRERGQAVADAVDRAGTPHLRMFDAFGRRVDEILYPPDYWDLLREGYRRGLVWRAFEGSLLPAYGLGYVTSFFDPGIYCPYTVSLATALSIAKHGDAELRARFLEPMLARDGAWQGATWMTEAGGGSDLGATVETVARELGGEWRLDGDKYFASNAGAELAVVAARPEGGAPGVKGLALFLVPRRRRDGSLNYAVRRLKDKIGTRSVPTGEVELRGSEAFLLGSRQRGVYLILEVLNVSRVANSVGSAALAQRAVADALQFASGRTAFGRPVSEHPLLAAQLVRRRADLERAFALAWEAARLLDEVFWAEPPYPPRYHLFRLLAHIAKHWTAENAAQTAKWALEVCAGPGTLAENRVERWLREAMILAIWEGTPHRQMLDALEAMERKGAHLALLQHLRGRADEAAIEDWQARLLRLLALPQQEREAGLDPLFSELGGFVADALVRRGRPAPAA